MRATIAVIVFLVVEAALAPVLAQTPGQQQPEFIRQGQELMRAGRLDDSLALYRQTLQTSPNSVPASIAAGSVLDLMQRGEEAGSPCSLHPQPREQGRETGTEANSLARPGRNGPHA